LILIFLKNKPNKLFYEFVGLVLFSLIFEKKETPVNCTGGLEKFVCLKSKPFQLTEK